MIAVKYSLHLNVRCMHAFESKGNHIHARAMKA